MSSEKLTMSGIEDDAGTAGGETVSGTAQSRKQKREAISPLVAPNVQHQKKTRPGSESESDNESDNSDDSVVNRQGTAITDASNVATGGDTPIFSRPMYPPDIMSVAQELKDMMLPEIKAVVCSQIPDMKSIVKDAVESALKDLNDKLNKQSEEIKELKTENEELRKELRKSNTDFETRVMQIEMANDTAEQYSRRNCLRIRGIPELVNEDTDRAVLDIARKLDVPMAVEDFDRSHRVGPATIKNRDVIVKFATYRARQRLYSKRKVLRDLPDMDKVFLNEDLTRTRGEILYYARRYIKDKQLKSAYSSDGKLFVYDNNETWHLIKTEKDLNAFSDLEELKEKIKLEKAERHH